MSKWDDEMNQEDDIIVEAHKGIEGKSKKRKSSKSKKAAAPKSEEPVLSLEEIEKAFDEASDAEALAMAGDEALEAISEEMDNSEEEFFADADADAEADADADADEDESFVEEQVEEFSATDREMKQAVTTLLFMTDAPLSLPKIRSLVNPDKDIKEYRELLQTIQKDLEDLDFGFEVFETARGWWFRTRVNCQKWVLKEKKISRIKLTPSALEVLSVIAYKQPIPKTEIDQMRGVDTSHILRGLMEKHLVKIVGRADSAGRSMLYSTTDEFLDLLGIKDLADLPSRTEVERMVPETSVGGIDEDQKAAIHNLVNRRGGLEDMYKTLDQDEELLDELRQDIAEVATTTPFLENERQRAKLRMKFEKQRSEKRKELEEQNLEPHVVDEMLALAGFGEDGFAKFLETHNVAVEDDQAMDKLMGKNSGSSDEQIAETEVVPVPEILEVKVEVEDITETKDAEMMDEVNDDEDLAAKQMEAFDAEYGGEEVSEPENTSDADSEEMALLDEMSDEVGEWPTSVSAASDLETESDWARPVDPEELNPEGEEVSAQEFSSLGDDPQDSNDESNKPGESGPPLISVE